MHRYGLGILLRTYSWEELRGSGPWLLGSLGVVILDILISLQVRPPRLSFPALPCSAVHGFINGICE